MRETVRYIDRPWVGGQQAGVKSHESAELAGHLIALPDSPWALWRCVGLRGAGFPESLALRLSATACAELADRALRLEEEKARAFQVALDEINGALDRLRAEQGWGDKSKRAPLLKASGA